MSGHPYQTTLTAPMLSGNDNRQCLLFTTWEVTVPLPEKMYGVVLTGHGGPQMLEWRDDLAVPKPGKGDVIIKVSAVGVNNTDINTRTAWYSKSGADAKDAAW